MSFHLLIGGNAIAGSIISAIDDTAWWQVIDAYLYTMILLLDLFFIAKDHGWHGLLMAGESYYRNKHHTCFSYLVSLCLVWNLFVLHTGATSADFPGIIDLAPFIVLAGKHGYSCLYSMEYFFRKICDCIALLDCFSYYLKEQGRSEGVIWQRCNPKLTIHCFVDEKVL